jgi:hypothetical protein
MRRGAVRIVRDLEDPVADGLMHMAGYGSPVVREEL